MGADAARCRMVGQNNKRYRLIELGESIENRTAHTVVEILNCSFLEFVVAFMSGFVACLHVKKHKIVVLQRLNGSRGLSFVVCVVKPGCTFNNYWT